MINRSFVINQLSVATDKAAEIMVKTGNFNTDSAKFISIGDTLIIKNNKGFYDIFTKNLSILFKDIITFDIATVIAQRYSSKEFSVIKKVKYLEEKYSKYHTDMIHYLHCLKSAKRKKDRERMSILEDKFREAEYFARNARDKISVFKRVK